MLKKLLIAATLLIPTFAHAEPIRFFEKTASKGWGVNGIYYSAGEQASACYATSTWKDGSVVEFNRPLDPAINIVWMSVRNTDWEFPTAVFEKDAELRMNAVGKNGKVFDGANIEFRVKDKSRIVMFLNPLVETAFNNAIGIKLIFKNAISNMGIGFDGSWKPVYNALTECIQAAKAKGVYGPPAKPETPVKPKGRDA